MKKMIKIATSFVLAFITLVASIINVNAQADTISIGQAYKVGHNYIANVTFSYKVTTDGRYLYCLELHKNTASNTTAKLVSNSSYIDGGLLYILKNGYPEKSITGDSDKDYYITQTAVWWYLDSTKGTGNLGNGFKNTGSDPYNLREYVRNLVNEGIAHKNDSITPSETKLTLSAGNESFTLQDNYFVSPEIKATTQNISTYSVTLNKNLTGTIISLNGKEFTYTKAFDVGANDTFKIKIPASSLTNTTETISVSAEATGNTEYRAYEYKPVDDRMQNVALLEKTNTKVSASTKLGIESSRVVITKIDSNTKKALAGAELVLKDSNGKVISKWTSTINGHIIRNLANGTYTIEETKAPSGYLLNKNTKKFTINSKSNNVTVSFENTPKNVVVNINKIDSETKKALAGAVLSVKNSAGKEIARFTTTEKSYVLTNLENGTYTVEEISAPSGYVKSNEKISFTIDDNHLSHQITIANTKEVPVPNTSSTSSLLVIILGIIMISFGIHYITKNAKN